MARNKAAVVCVGALAAATAGLLVARVRSGRTDRSRSDPHVPDAGWSRKTRVVVVGAGFGGLAVARALAGMPGVALTVIDARNHHLFQPLLYQVATSALSPADIAAPVRTILPPSADLRVLMATVTGVDTGNKAVLCADAPPVPYDQLVVSTGSETSYFGHTSWQADAPGLKSLDDALRLRNAIVSAFERAVATDDPEERRRLLTFVLIGGGPTGVEMAGAIGELVRDRLRQAYGLASDRARIVLIEAGHRILSAFASDLSDRAAAELRSLDVEIRTGTRVSAIATGRVTTADETIAAETVIWTAGTTASPVASWLRVTPGHGGRVEVGDDLRVPGRADVFVIGDAALARDADGQPLAALAPVAKQQGGYVADTLRRLVQAEPAPAPFRYRDYGILATVGRNKAVAQFGAVHLSGFPAWLTWAGAHIAFLISFRSRVFVSLEWAFAYATHGRAAGLIIDRDPLSDQPSRRGTG